MADKVAVTPRAQRASWAREKTQYDGDDNMQAKPAPTAAPARRVVIISVEIDDTYDALDRVCRVLSADGRAKIIRVTE